MIMILCGPSFQALTITILCTRSHLPRGRPGPRSRAAARARGRARAPRRRAGSCTRRCPRGRCPP